MVRHEDWPEVTAWLISRTVEGEKTPCWDEPVCVRPNEMPPGPLQELRSAGAMGMIKNIKRKHYRIGLDVVNTITAEEEEFVTIERAPYDPPSVPLGHFRSPLPA